MALFKSVPAISTQKDTSKPIGKKPEAKVTDADFEIKKPMSSLEEDEILKSKIKELGEDAPEEVYFEDEEDTPKIEEKKEAPKKEVKEAPKKEAKPEVKAELKEEAKPEVKEEAKTEETRPLTPEEKKARQLENLRKARLAREAAKAKENENMTEAKTEKPRKLVTETKKPVDMSKMVMTAKPKKDTGGKTVYHVSKRGETREDRVWKVFIQESNKVLQSFDYQEEALEYAKQLAKNKKDGSYVILHGLNGKIRKY